jgi:hypothetical protein
MIASSVQTLDLLKLLFQQEIEYLWVVVRNKNLECNIFQDISFL